MNFREEVTGGQYWNALVDTALAGWLLDQLPSPSAPVHALPLAAHLAGHAVRVLEAFEAFGPLSDLMRSHLSNLELHP